MPPSHRAEPRATARTASAPSATATYVRGRVSEVASVTATLGFDPLKVLSIWLRRAEEQGEAPREAPDEHET